MKTINLVLGTHNHQPVGNFDFVFARSFEQAYEPFLDLLEQFPGIKFSQHYSGVLLSWLSENKPAFVDRLRGMAARGQIELIGGAYYEAILSQIPDEDKAGQLQLMTRALRKHFGTRPVGMWLAERVWEQHVVKFIADEGYRYLIVDDTHFKYAGVDECDLLGYYRTEEQGRSLAVFPVSKRLRYTIPFQQVETTIEYLRSLATEEGDRIVVFADDGEKFGVWPKTHDHVYGSGWLKNLFQSLTDNASWIRLLHFDEALRLFPARGRIYLPNASYAEMMHWALPEARGAQLEKFESELGRTGLFEPYEPFVRGGFWRLFLVKYPEANSMHKKMLRVSDRARKLQARGKRISGKTISKVLAAQCNDPYWHGVFGGLYMPVLRFPVYHNLISAEKDLDAVEHKKDVRLETSDFDCDGHDELLVESPLLNCYLKPDSGGSVFELDFKPISVNLTDIISRRRETYHRRLESAQTRGSGEVVSIHDIVSAKEQGLERHLVYDWYRRASLIDHCFGEGTTLEGVGRNEYSEEGDFVSGPYTGSPKRKARVLQITLAREGRITRGDRHHSLRVEKTLTFDPKKSDIEIDYCLTNLDPDPFNLWFAVEWNIGLQAGNDENRYYYDANGRLAQSALRSAGEIPASSFLGLRDEWNGVDVRINVGTPADFWRFPLETVSQSESGFERIFQSSVVLPNWKLTLEREWRCTMTLNINALAGKGTLR